MDGVPQELKDQITSLHQQLNQKIQEAAALSQKHMQTAQDSSPPCAVQMAMQFVAMCQKSLSSQLPILDDSDVGLIVREMDPCEKAAFQAACDLIYEYFHSNSRFAK